MFHAYSVQHEDAIPNVVGLHLGSCLQDCEDANVDAVVAGTRLCVNLDWATGKPVAHILNKSFNTVC